MILALERFFSSRLGVYLFLSVVLACLWYISLHFDLIEKRSEDRVEEEE